MELFNQLVEWYSQGVVERWSGEVVTLPVEWLSGNSQFISKETVRSVFCTLTIV